MKRTLAAGAALATSAALLTVIAPAAHAAATLLVPSRYRTIGAAINAAHNGDTILVSPGTYRENLTIMGKAITIKAANANPAMTVIAGNPGRTPVMIQNVGAGMRLLGFRIANGSAPSGQGGGITIANGASPVIAYNQIIFNRSNDGAGILVWNHSNPDIAYNYIENNVAATFGGGVFAVRASNPTLHHNVIMANHASGGGGIYLEDDPANRAAHAGGLITLNTIANNASSGEGGGIMLRTGEVAQITRNRITGNRSPYGGGIEIETNGSGPTVIGNVIQGNSAPTSQPGSGSGGGIAVFGQSTPLIQGNTITDNAAGVYGGGLVLAEGSRSLVTSNNIATNRVTSTAAGTGGGGIYEGNSDSEIWNNVIRGNSAHGGGGLCFSGTGNWVVLNNTVIGNSSTGTGTAAYGGGMFVGGKTTGKTSIVNNIFAQNNDFQIFDSGHLSSYDNNLVVNGGKGSYYGYGTGVVTNIAALNGNSTMHEASGNLSGNLGFMNVAAADYRLTSASAAVNRARLAGAPSNDYRGARRPYGGGDDIGAYEWIGEVPSS
ncbi:MAG TPA: right-handed parallel beta-helix repeat-containing protein [Jatrophihabitans sp.]|nr:right-handed parallel beta-helix repeat-containing protein [Jatrophihabitans sp.]